jgi:glycosyltransferase involved in cell wall biosynthesis
MHTLSVVIPTYNRCETLQKAICAHLNQTALENISEIIVVDDGSTDSTKDVVMRLSEASSLSIRYFRQANKGPAAARNVGVREARSELVLFTDDDIIPEPTLTAQHLDWHRRFPDLPIAVLGKVTWAQEVKATPFMKWYGSDALFAYAHFIGRTELDYTDFYTCNLSLKTAFLRRNGVFDEEFKVAAYEDVELAYRLKKAGMRLLYNPNALAYHQQYVSFDDACRRARKAGLAEEVFRQKEAGIYFASRQSTMLSPLAQRLLPFKKRLHFLKKHLALAFLPLKSVMDWRLPLPWSVYRMMLRIYR